MTDLISRADAVKAIRKCKFESVMPSDWYIGMECAQGIVKDVPSAELNLQTPQTYGKSINPSNAEVVEDYISRADAIEAVQTYLNILINSRRHGDDFTFINVLTDIRNKISALPSADTIEFDFNKYQPRVRNKVCDGTPSADTVSREFYNDAVKANIRILMENKELKEQIESAEAEPKWNCTANFVAEQLDRLRNMTDEERLDFLKRFFSPSAEAEKKKAELKENGDWDCPDVGCDECDHHRSVEWCSLAIPNHEKEIDETYKMVNEAFFEGFDAAEKRYKFLIEYVEELDKKSAEAEWIPCSERLPSESGQYICTLPFGDNDDNEVYVWALSFHNGRFYDDDDEFGMTFYDDVIAWMPLPKPYREDGEA